MKYFSGIITFLLLLIIYLIKKNPTMINDKLKDSRTFQNSHNLQVESYFRQVGNEEIKNLLNDWTSLIVNMDKTPKVEFMTKLTQQTIMLGSSRTVKLVADMMQFNYINSQNNKRNEDFTFTFMIYIAMIISSLKQDFTGYKTEPLDIIRIKISDYDKFENKYRQIYKKLKR